MSGTVPDPAVQLQIGQLAHMPSSALDVRGGRHKQYVTRKTQPSKGTGRDRGGGHVCTSHWTRAVLPKMWSAPQL